MPKTVGEGMDDGRKTAKITNANSDFFEMP